MSKASVEKMKATAPFIFQMSVDQTLRPVVSFLASILTEQDELDTFSTIFASTRLEMDDATQKKVVRVILNNSSILSLTLEGNLFRTVEFLRNSCYMDKHSLATMVKQCAGILGLSVEDNLRLTLAFLVDQVGLTEEKDLRRCIGRHPQILGLSLENLQSKVEFFHSIDGRTGDKVRNMSEKQKRGSLAFRIAVSAPSVYSLSLRDNIVPKLATLGKVWEEPQSSLETVMRSCSAPKSQEHVIRWPSPGSETLSRRLKEYPVILTLSLDANILPTLQFFNRTRYVSLDSGGYAVFDSLTTVSARYVAASLYTRLLPRWHYIQQQQQQQQGVLSTSDEKKPQLPPLHILAASDDTKFCKHFKFDESTFSRYKEYAIPKLKFSSQFENWIKTGTPIDN